ncbi:acyltransferase family protein [Mesorhizobium sp.]|uniref:acyltransferase family protein n=1 Tax=Mesorhizobium sp. TaxID=1871066 RepID=UPI000FE7AA4B|nr:acyltransferase family protein [Mesorhizobium sp.]RWP53589.1 MAG: acyltransferase [Mesorhizobium sp.]RWQ78120.1 MAG: acyltransferase [Mesorhizobium sp.]
MALGYRPQLDGLRAIAIGLVGVEHFGGPWVRTHFPIGAGALGVQLFFVLSGFLITRNLLFRLEQAPAGEVIRRFFPIIRSATRTRHASSWDFNQNISSSRLAKTFVT